MNLTSFLPKPFTMTCGAWEITSPVPTVEAGKLITAFQAMQAEQARRIDAGEPPLNDSEVEGIPTNFDELAPIVLGAEQVTALEADGPTAEAKPPPPHTWPRSTPQAETRRTRSTRHSRTRPQKPGPANPRRVGAVRHRRPHRRR